MKKWHWVTIFIIGCVALIEGYVLYKIPKSELLNGRLHYEYPVEVELGTSFKLSFESRAQGESNFAILGVSEAYNFNQFPQHFTLPILSHSLSDLGIYQLRVQVFKQDKLLFVNKGLLPLTRSDLLQPLNIDMQLPRTIRSKRLYLANRYFKAYGI